MTRYTYGIIAFSLLALSTTTNAALITKQWQVSDAVSTHGLWTNGLSFNGDNSFNFTNDTFLTEYDDGTATLLGGAEDSGVTWVINILFEGYNADPDGPVKTGGGPLLDSWDFYYETSGTISTSDDGGFVANVSRMGPALQIGFGANDKTSDFGASAWLSINGGGHSSHWDLNMDLVAVPEPSIIALFGLGLLGLGFARRRKA